MQPNPFPYAVLDDFWPDTLLDGIVAEFPRETDERWQRFRNDKELKLGGSREQWGSITSVLFNDGLAEPTFCNMLAREFETPPLTMDPRGGGYHLIPPGGYLAQHVDFNRSEDGLWRRLNLIIFLNRDWHPQQRGELVLGQNSNSIVIQPVFNRTVVFETSDTSWHGHPIPTAPDFWRKSVAAYYFSQESPTETSPPHDTIFLT